MGDVTITSDALVKALEDALSAPKQAAGASLTEMLIALGRPVKQYQQALLRRELATLITAGKVIVVRASRPTITGSHQTVPVYRWVGGRNGHDARRLGSDRPKSRARR